MAEVEGEALVKLIWTDELLQAGGTRNATTWGSVLEPQMMGIFQHQNPGMSRKCPSSAWEFNYLYLPSGKHTKNYGKSQFLMGKSTINGHFQ